MKKYEEMMDFFTPDSDPKLVKWSFARGSPTLWKSS